MILRGACQRDIKYIREMFDKYDFILDTKHLERLIVTEEKDIITGILYLNTLLECSFLTDENLSSRIRVGSLKLLVEQGKKEVKNLGFELVHAFANEKIEDILRNHFDFIPGKGKNLILHME